MRKSVKIGTLFAILGLVGLASWVLVHPHKAEPLYRGKKLTEWLQAGAPPDRDEWIELNAWMRDQTPSLIAALQVQDNSLRRPYLWIKLKAPAFLGRRMPTWFDPKETRLAATFWLGQNGAVSLAAVPQLCELVIKDTSHEVRRGAIWALSQMHSTSQTVQDTLVAALTSDLDPDVRAAAAGGLEMSMAIPSNEIVRAFIRGLNDRNPLVRQVSAAALGKCGPRAAAALEPLKNLANSNDEAADYARSAMAQISAAALPPPE